MVDGADAAVDLDVDVEATVDDELAQLGDLGLHGGDVGLAAEAGVDRHDQDHVDQVEHVLDGRDGVDGLRATAAWPRAR